MSLHLAPADSRLADAVAVGGWLDDSDANQAMGYGSGVEGALRASQGFLEALQTKPGVLFGVYRGEEPLAFVVLRKASRGVTQFHGLVAPEYRNTIWAARVIQAIEETAFSNGTNRLETEVLVRNQRATRLLKGLGFVPEGAHKDRHEMDGRWWSTLTLRKLKKERR